MAVLDVCRQHAWHGRHAHVREPSGPTELHVDVPGLDATEIYVLRPELAVRPEGELLGWQVLTLDELTVRIVCRQLRAGVRARCISNEAVVLSIGTLLIDRQVRRNRNRALDVDVVVVDGQTRRCASAASNGEQITVPTV